MNLSLLDLWASMSLFAQGIIVLLFLMSVLSATIALQKAVQFRRSRRATVSFARPFSSALARDDLEEAQRVAERHAESPLAVTLGSLVVLLRSDASEVDTDAWEIGAVERLTELGALDQLADLRKGLGVLATTGSTAPFVGLLGTVVGVVNAFRGMAVSGSGGLGAISQGIAEALVATAFGLLVAIPAVWLYNYFVDRMELVSMELSFSSKELIEFMLRDRRARARRRARSS